MQRRPTFALPPRHIPATFTATGGETASPGTCGDPQDGRWNAFKSKFNIIKECNNTTGCWATNAEAWWQSTTKYGFISNDGMYWISPFYGTDEAHIAVDVNGEKGPNQWGKDMFYFLLGRSSVRIATGSTPGQEIDGVCSYRLAEPVTINGRQVYLSQPLYQ